MRFWQHFLQKTPKHTVPHKIMLPKNIIMNTNMTVAVGSIVNEGTTHPKAEPLSFFSLKKYLYVLVKFILNDTLDILV